LAKLGSRESIVLVDSGLKLMVLKLLPQPAPQAVLQQHAAAVIVQLMSPAAAPLPPIAAAAREGAAASRGRLMGMKKLGLSTRCPHAEPRTVIQLVSSACVTTKKGNILSSSPASTASMWHALIHG
jgi:hypothetical protein